MLAQQFDAKTERIANSQQVTGEAITPSISGKRPVKRIADIIKQAITRTIEEAPVKPPDDCILNKRSMRIENNLGQPAIEPVASRPERPQKKRRKNRPHL